MDGQLKDILDLLQSMGVILAGVFYLAIVLWTYKDARKRIEDPILIATATATSMLPIVGVFVYMLLRPSEYLADVRERELEIRMMERQLGRQERCPYCKSHIDGDYLSCPVCTTKLRQECIGCEKPLDPRWVMCPFCETEVPGRAPAQKPAPKPKGGSVRPPRSSSADRGEPRPSPKPASSGRSATRSSNDAKPATRSSKASSSPRSTKPASDKGSNGGGSRPKKSDGIDTEPFGSGSDSSSRFIRSSELPPVTTTRPLIDN